MSWAQDEWKYNLPHAALQKIDALEKNIEQLRKDQQQKKFKIDSLEVSFENQKKKTEKEKSEVAILKKELHGLEEQCREGARNYEKVCLIALFISKMLFSIILDLISFTFYQSLI